MRFREALKGQYHAGLEQLRQTVDRCPDGLWTGGAHPRTYWRIAYHAIFYTHLYLQQSYDDFKPWERMRESCSNLWGENAVEEAYTRSEILAYIRLVDDAVDATVDALDLETEETGFSWYKSMNKLDHEMMNLRHLQGHVGQLSELLMAQGIDIDWVGKRSG